MLTLLNHNPNQVVVNNVLILKRTLHDSYVPCDAYTKKLNFSYSAVLICMDNHDIENDVDGSAYLLDST